MMQAYFQILPKENLTDGSIPLYHKVIVDGESPVAICILGEPSLSLATFRYERVCQQQHFFGFKNNGYKNNVKELQGMLLNMMVANRIDLLEVAILEDFN